jgi:hypothetical protein
MLAFDLRRSACTEISIQEGAHALSIQKGRRSTCTFNSKRKEHIGRV